MTTWKAESASLTALTFLTLLLPTMSLFYTNSRENDYPRIGKRIQLADLLKRVNLTFRKVPFNKTGRFESYGSMKRAGAALERTYSHFPGDSATDSAPIDDLKDDATSDAHTNNAVKFDKLNSHASAKSTTDSLLHSLINLVANMNNLQLDTNVSPELVTSDQSQLGDLRMSQTDRIKFYKVIEKDYIAKLVRMQLGYSPELEIDVHSDLVSEVQ